MLAGHSGAHRPSSHTLNADLGGLWFLFPPGIWSPRNLREFDPSGGGQEVLGRGGVGSEAEQLEAWLEKAEPRLDRGRAVSAGGGDIQGAATASVRSAPEKKAAPRWLKVGRTFPPGAVMGVGWSSWQRIRPRRDCREQN